MMLKRFAALGDMMGNIDARDAGGQISILYQEFPAGISKIR